MDTKKYGVVACLDEFGGGLLDQFLVECLDKDNKDDFDVDISNSRGECFGSFLLPHL